MTTTQKPLTFAAAVQGSGTFDTTVSWSASAGTIDSSGNYTPPPNATGALAVSVTATSSEDSSQSASAVVTVIFNWVQYYAPQGLNDGATAVALSSDGTELVVADARDVPGLAANPADQYYTSQTAGLLLFNTQTGELLDSTWTNSPTPSRIVSMVTDPGSGIIYAAGYEWNDVTRLAFVLKITASNPPQVSKLAEFQLGNVRTEAHVVQLYGGNLYLAVNSDYQPYPPGSSWRDYAVIVDPGGNIEPELPLATFSGTSDITGMCVTNQWIWASGNAWDPNPSGGGQLETVYEGRYDPTTGEVELPFFKGFSVTPAFFNSSIFQNAAGEVLLAGASPSSATQEVFYLSGNDTQFNPNLAAEWDGGNGGTVSVNIEMGATLNPQGGVTVVGSCSQIGSNDPSQTDACAISWSGVPNAGTGHTVQVFWEQRFDTAHMPSGTSAVFRDAIYDSQGNLYLVGTGSDGRSGCGATPCSTATIGKFPPPTGS